MPRARRRALSLPAVILGIVVATVLLDQAAQYAAQVATDRRAAARAGVIADRAHDLDADLAQLARNDQTSFMTTIALGEARSLASLSQAGLAVPTAADAPFRALPGGWQITPYVANLATETGTALPYGLLYIEAPASDRYLVPAIRSWLSAHGASGSDSEPVKASDLVSAAIGHTLDPSAEIAIFTAPFAGINPAYVLRAARAGWPARQMRVSLDMNGQALSNGGTIIAQSADVADGIATGSLIADTMKTSDKLTAASAELHNGATAQDLSAGTLRSSNLDLQAMQADTGSLGSVQSVTADLTSLRADILSSEDFTLTGNGTLSSGVVRQETRGDHNTPGKLTFGTLSASAAGGVSGYLSQLHVQTCTGCR